MAEIAGINAPSAEIPIIARRSMKLKTSRSQSRTLGLQAPLGGQLSLARERVVKAFATHWLSILRTRKDTAKRRACFFFAGSTAAKGRLARSFYGRDHARKMANLTAPEIVDTLKPWLDHALEFWLSEYERVGNPAGDDFLDQLATSEYVSIVHPHSPTFGSGVGIDRYPGERAVQYDDLYERMLCGFSQGGVLRIYKSTGESFTPFEARLARAGIKRDLMSGIMSSGDDDPWVIDLEPSMEPEGQWTPPGFKSEDLTRVIAIEVNQWEEVLGRRLQRIGKRRVPEFIKVRFRGRGNLDFEL